MNPVVKADCNDVFIVAGGSIFKYDRSMCLKKQANLSMVNCGTGSTAVIGTPALAIADQDVYVVAGNLVSKFDRELCTVTQAALPLPNCTAIAVTNGQIVPTANACPPANTCPPSPAPVATAGIGMAMNPAITVDGQDVYVVAAGTVFHFDRSLCFKRQASLPQANCAAVALTPGQAVAPETLHAVSTALGTPAISVIDQDVFVVAGVISAKFDRDLNPCVQAALPFAAGTSIAVLPGGPINFNQMAMVPNTFAPVVAAAPVCGTCATPVAAAPICTTPTVAGFVGGADLWHLRTPAAPTCAAPAAPTCATPTAEVPATTTVAAAPCTTCTTPAVAAAPCTTCGTPRGSRTLQHLRRSGDTSYATRATPATRAPIP